MNPPGRKRLNNILVILILFTSFHILIACQSEDQITPQAPQAREDGSFDADLIPSNAILKKKIIQGEYLHFEHYAIEDGLSQSTVFCILQDSQGYMWFGTEDGLNKFDGYSFTVYKHNPDDPGSLSSNWIQTMLEDDSGNLWIGTRDGGLNKYDQALDQFIHYRFNPEDPASLSDDEITALLQDQDGSIWVGTGNGGLDKFDPLTGRFVHYRHNPENVKSLSPGAILSLFHSNAGTLWVGTNGGGLNRFDRTTETFDHFLNDPGDIHSLVDNTVWSIFEDSAGALWIGTSAGLDRFDPVNETFTHFRNNPGDPASLAYDVVQTIYEDKAGTLWIGTYGGGINTFDQDSQTFGRYGNFPGDPHSISSNIIMSIYQDREGVLWFGTIGGGISKLDLGRVNFTHYRNDPMNANSLSNNMVRAFFQDPDDTLWVGTMFSGLNRFDPETQKWQQYSNDPNDPSSLSDNFVSTIYRDRAGVLWVGTIHGLDRFEPNTETFVHFDLHQNDPMDASRIEVTAILESQDDTFWIGTTDGFYPFNRQDEVWGEKENFDLASNQALYVYIISEDQRGQLWIGTLGSGIYIYNPKDGNFSHYQHEPGNAESLSQNFVTALLIDDTGLAWIGTNGNGLDRFDLGTGEFTHYQEDDGLPNDSVYCLLKDRDENIWLSTNNGLSRFNPRTELFSNYDMTDGLQSNEFNAKACINANNGEMIFGGINGFNVFEPESVQGNPVIPPIVISSMSKNEEAIDLDWSHSSTSEITLKWPVNSFDFEYAALSFAQPEKNQYAYYLEGFEDTWKEVGNRRFGQYTNLPGGSYTLRVRGSNNSGVWNEAGIAVQITVVPPFWQTGWFFAVLVLAILGVFYGGYRFRVRSLKKRERELEQQVEERTSELLQTQANLKQIEMDKAVSKERTRLARDLHDSVTQSIYSLTLLSEAGQRMIKRGDFSQAEGNQMRLGEIAQQALQEMRLLVYELRPQVLEQEGFIGALQHRLESVEKRAGINARMRVDPQLDIPPDLEEELFHIAIEALNNALKHAQASEVSLSIEKDEAFLVLTIADNGRGFDADLAKSQGGVGIASMTERAEKIGGSIRFHSLSTGGTKIIIKVSLNPIHPHFIDQPKEGS